MRVDAAGAMQLAVMPCFRPAIARLRARPMTPPLAMPYAVFDDYTGVVLDLEEGKRIAHALGGTKAVILSNHGLLTVGHSVDEAAWWFITMERTCQAQLLAEAAGTPVLIDREQAEKTAGQVGHRRSGWMSFQPLYDWIVVEQPDLLDE